MLGTPWIAACTAGGRATLDRLCMGIAGAGGATPPGMLPTLESPRRSERENTAAAAKDHERKHENKKEK